ncbi:MAG: hypothetical protein NTW87_06110, partial [Planctomycetota bacterium]|nr:hypothetical protein [Planctomycetota bacterium]
MTAVSKSVEPICKCANKKARPAPQQMRALEEPTMTTIPSNDTNSNTIPGTAEVPTSSLTEEQQRADEWREREAARRQRLHAAVAQAGIGPDQGSGRRRRRSRSVHAELLEKHGLPKNLCEAAELLGIKPNTLRYRILRNSITLLNPLRRYGERPVTLALNVPAVNEADNSKCHITGDCSNEVGNCVSLASYGDDT